MSVFSERLLMVVNLDIQYSVPAGLSAEGWVLPELFVNTDADIFC